MDPRRLLPALAVMTLLVLVLCGWAVLRPAATAPRDATSAGAAGDGSARAEAAALELLRDWDSLRAEAWAEGDVAALRSLYVTGSESAEADVEMLRRYVARGLVVEDLETQVLDLALLRDPAPGTLRLQVTDRVSGGSVVTRDGVRRVLPVDEASIRVVTLRQVDGTWLVAEARDVRG